MNMIIVQGKKVDLDSATLLGSYSYGTGNSDVNYIQESIYETAKGNFVFLGEGGANTHYAEQISTNTKSQGKRAYFLNKDEVIKKLEQWGKEKILLEKFADDLDEA